MSSDGHDTENNTTKRIISAVSVATGFLVLIAAFILVARLTRRPTHWAMYQASLRRRGIDELQEIGEVPELWEVRLREDEEEELLPLSAHLHSSIVAELVDSKTQETNASPSPVVLVAFLLLLPGDVEAKTRALDEEGTLMDMEIGVTKWRVEGGLEEFG